MNSLIFLDKLNSRQRALVLRWPAPLSPRQVVPGQTVLQSVPFPKQVGPRQANTTVSQGDRTVHPRQLVFRQLVPTLRELVLVPRQPALLRQVLMSRQLVLSPQQYPIEIALYPTDS